MIDMQSAACTASFMTMGMCNVDAKHRIEGPNSRYNYDMYQVWDQGGVELHLEVVQYAVLAEEYCDYVAEQCSMDFPGVFDYEVSEPFGEWFTEYLFETGEAPSKAVATHQLILMISGFFTQCDDTAEKSFNAGVLFAKIKEHFNV